WRGAPEVLDVYDHTRDQQRHKRKTRQPVQRVEGFMQIGWSDAGAENSEGADNSAPGAEIDYQPLELRRRSSSLRNRHERINTGVLPAIMKSLPRPVHQKYIRLDDCACESEEEPGEQSQDDWEVDVSRLVLPNNLRKVFVEVKEKRGRYMRGAEEKQQRSRTCITKH